MFSHHSAAAIWGFPRPASWPTDVHITVPQALGGRSQPGIVRHSATTPAALPSGAIARGGLLVTSAAQTAVTMARVLPFPQAVAMMDKAIHVPRRMAPGGGPVTILVTRAELQVRFDDAAGFIAYVDFFW